MAIQTRNKRSVAFSMASMSDLVFLLLIFFMLTSTLVAPNAIKLLLPESSSKAMAKQTITVYINESYQYFLEDRPVDERLLEEELIRILLPESEATVVLRADQTVPIQNIVSVIDAVNIVNEKNLTKHKVILATRPKR
ncbi:MAG: biopolymer transporter ExbD [Bacteroidales bacterium]|nr:biopolymer transporter ExbD [Bacteroidales bacterium]MDZ4205268.1 biopolymer transporter ExbD [Bacteroidales bacterium]